MLMSFPIQLTLRFIIFLKCPSLNCTSHLKTRSTKLIESADRLTLKLINGSNTSAYLLVVLTKNKTSINTKCQIIKLCNPHGVVFFPSLSCTCVSDSDDSRGDTVEEWVDTALLLGFQTPSKTTNTTTHRISENWSEYDPSRAADRDVGQRHPPPSLTARISIIKLSQYRSLEGGSEATSLRREFTDIEFIKSSSPVRNTRRWEYSTIYSILLNNG